MSFLRKQESIKNNLNIDKINLKKQVFYRFLLDSRFRGNDIKSIYRSTRE
ncbi:MAG: hypothetical protein ACEY3D_03170 [Rickettsia sp.]